MDDSLVAWLVLAFGEERSYGGNVGYEEDFRTLYRFDSDVQNHKQVRRGSIMLIRNQDKLLGAARIADVTASAGTKTYRRCPECKTTSHIERTTKSPRFRCKNKHEFDELQIDVDTCTNYEATFGASFQPARAEISMQALRGACPNYADQVSIQRLQLNLLGHSLREAIPDLGTLLDPSIELKPLDVSPPEEPFTPSDEDRREVILRQLKQRRGQAKFRKGLIDRYGGKCLVSGCEFVFIVEAAHISPYRGEDDNHPQNGLLLRPDLHTLFDLDLLGIDPDTLEVHIHPQLAASAYASFASSKLQCGSHTPSRAALASRWEVFTKRRAEAL
jgi:putative restriction endonuclease